MPEPMWTPTRSSFSGVTFSPDCGHGLGRRGHGEVDESRHLARFLLVDELEGIEVLDFGGKGDREIGGVKGGNGGHPALAGQQIVPDLGGGVADSADQPDAGYYDAP